MNILQFLFKNMLYKALLPKNERNRKEKRKEKKDEI